MRYHKEGHRPLIFTAVIILLVLAAIQNGLPLLTLPALVICIGLYVFMLNFFRHPERPILKRDDQTLYAPADGKVLVIEETYESEALKEQRIQVSIFMSPLNVHVNRYPTGGKIVYSKYHPGKFLLAWDPKSSLANERTTVVLENSWGSVLVRQIAGYVARRIICYAETGDLAVQGEELGFIKFGSRVDLFLPKDAEIAIGLNDVVVGNETVIARFADPKGAI